MNEMEEYKVWHWYKWEMGEWHQSFHGTKEQCEKWKNKYGCKDDIIAIEKPLVRYEVGNRW